MNRLRSRYDFIVVGAGVGGLAVARAICRLGAEVLVVEAGERLAPGPSTRNGGFVHAGGFHSAVIEDPDIAREVADRCRRGRDRLLGLYPEAVVPAGSSIYLLGEGSTIRQRMRERWPAWEIEHSLQSTALAVSRFPGLDVAEDTLIARTSDVAFNWRLALKMMTADIMLHGGHILAGARVVGRTKYGLMLSTKEGDRAVESERVVYAAGYGSADLVRVLGSQWDTRPSIKLWKSHVLSIPKVWDDGFMYLDPGRISIVPQKGYALVCQSQEDTEVEDADFRIVPKRVRAIITELRRAVPFADAIIERAVPHACLKPTVVAGVVKSRSVKSQVLQVSPTEWMVFPGKATESILLADEVVHEFDLDAIAADITPRPGDTIDFTRVSGVSAHLVERAQSGVTATDGH